MIDIYRLGFPLDHFREEKSIRKNVIGKRGVKYSVIGFKFKNILDTKAGGNESLIAIVNDFVHDVLFRRLNVDLSVRRVTMVMFHSALDDEEGLFCNLNTQTNPGKTVWSFIEKFAQSGKVINFTDDISFDFWIA